MSIRETADARRHSLIKATAACLAETGVSGTSVRTICARAGVSPGLLTHYFSGIDDLIAQTYRDVTVHVLATLLEATAAAGKAPRDRLIAFVTASFRPPVADPSLLATWLAFWSLVKTDSDIAAIHRQAYREYRSSVELLLGDCGLSAEQAGPAAIALSALVDGLWLELTLDPSTFSAGQAEAIAIRWVDVLLRDPDLG
jgi:AcrR family transcriptional regulator